MPLLRGNTHGLLLRPATPVAGECDRLRDSYRVGRVDCAGGGTSARSLWDLVEELIGERSEVSRKICALNYLN
jgi:hypothetical protein